MSIESVPKKLRLADLRPYFSITVLECTAEDVDRAFTTLQGFLRRSASEPGQALAIRITAEIVARASDTDDADGVGSLRELGFDQLYGVARERARRPGWAIKDSMFTDLINELTIALRRDRLVAVRTDDTRSLLTWVDRDTTPYRRLPTSIMSTTFDGDGKALWLRGVHRRRRTKPDGKALIGLRLQEALDALEDSTYAMTAMKVDFLPQDDSAILRGNLSISPERSHISLKSMPSFLIFLVATAETLTLLDKALTSEKSPRLPYPELAIPESNLSNVFGAFDIRVVDPDEVRSEPHFDEVRVARAELLREAILSVHGDPSSSSFVVDVGFDGSLAGRLKATPVAVRDGCELKMRYAETPSAEAIAREIRDAIGHGDLLNVYFESGHVFNGQQISRQNLASKPFPNLAFADFSGFTITREKPNASGDQAIHDKIAQDGDDSLFAWVVGHFRDDWLVCDDGAGEIADFLHLAEDGTLTAIHVKASYSSSANRGIAVTAFEQVVSQAEKNIRMLNTDDLVDRLSTPRIERPACWHTGKRVVDRTEFIERLRTRVATDRTRVIIVQPHLLHAVCDRARTAMQEGFPNRDSYSLVLLDNLLHSTRRTVTGLWDDLIVIGCA